MNNTFFHRATNGVIECNKTNKNDMFIEIGIFEGIDLRHNEFLFLDKSEVILLRDYLNKVLGENNE